MEFFLGVMSVEGKNLVGPRPIISVVFRHQRGAYEQQLGLTIASKASNGNGRLKK
jgi:hypothetical protein